MKRATLQGKEVLWVHMAKGNDPPYLHRSRGVVFVRRGAQTGPPLRVVMNRRQLLEARREMHEYYLRRCLGPGFSLEVKGRSAVILGWQGEFELHFPAR